MESVYEDEHRLGGSLTNSALIASFMANGAFTLLDAVPRAGDW